LDGKIEVETTIKKGSMFTIMLPESVADIAGIADDDNEAIFSTYENGVVF
jgi:hypothetical protein